MILVIDTLNLPASQVPLAKSEAEKFLRRNHGHLAQPVSLYFLSSGALFVSCPGYPPCPPSTTGTLWLTRSLVDGELPVIRWITGSM